MPINQSVFFFGNSLVNYAEGGAFTNVPFWMNSFAQFDDNSLAVNGGYGFLRNFADTEEPDANWGFEGVQSLYDGETSSFAENAFDNVVITPANFIQDRSPNANYFDEARSPLEAAREIVDNLGETQPDATIFVYQGWADLAPFAPDGTEPSAADLAAYHDYNTGEYTDWYTTFTNGLQANAPDADIQLIPIANVLSTLLSSQPLSQIPFDDLYVDSAPHGTETLYFLAGLTSYAAIYGTNPAADYPVPDTVHPAVSIHFQEVTEIIADTLQDFGFDVATPQAGANDHSDTFATLPQQVQTDEDTQAQDDDQGAADLPAADDISQIARPAPQDDTPAQDFELGAQTVAHDPEGFGSFTRVVDVQSGGPYLFELTADDLATLIINGAPVLINQGDTPDTSQDVTVDLPAGENTVQVEYYQDGGGEVLILDIGPENASDHAKDDFPLPPVDFEEIPEEDDELDFV